MFLATRGDGPTRRLLDASHRSVVGGLGVEGQEDGSVIISVENLLDGPLSELDDLQKREVRPMNADRSRGGADSPGYILLAGGHYAPRRWCCGLNLWHIFACRRKEKFVR